MSIRLFIPDRIVTRAKAEGKRRLVTIRSNLWIVIAPECWYTCLVAFFLKPRGAPAP